MRITYQISYNALFMLKDGKRPVTRAIQETDEVDIPEVTGADAPIAATWREGVVAQPENRKEFHVRTFKGRCYEPCPQTGRAGGDIREIVRQMSDADAKPGKIPSEDTIIHRLGDNRDYVRRFREERLAGLLIVDGVPYIRCDRPSLNLTVQDMARLSMKRIRTRYAGTHDSFGIDQTLVAPLTSFEAVVRRANEGPLRFAQWVFDVEVFLPEAIDFDTKAEAVVRTVGQAIADNEVALHHWPRAVAEEFLAVRADYERWFDDPDSVDVVDLLDRTYTVVTQHYGLYNQTLVASFLCNYDKVQSYIPDLEIAVNLSPRA